RQGHNSPLRPLQIARKGSGQWKRRSGKRKGEEVERRALTGATLGEPHATGD
ncbi:hypothetical protein U1Q18_018181, partial [Sarracenia purpurea var. burkii]